MPMEPSITGARESLLIGVLAGTPTMPPACVSFQRVPGLRREEVAVLAGVSTDWYIRLEKGHIAGVSEDVLEAVARALQLDEARTLSQSLGTAEEPYDLEVTLDTIIMGIDAQLGALEKAGEPDTA